MKFFKNRKVVKGGLAFVLLGFLFASIPFFQIIHNHTYSTDHSKVAHVKEYEAKCCTPIKIQNHFQGILTAKNTCIKISFIDDYSFRNYYYFFKSSVNLSNKAPPATLIV